MPTSVYNKNIAVGHYFTLKQPHFIMTDHLNKVLVKAFDIKVFIDPKLSDKNGIFSLKQMTK